jgi:hypothetical protein
MKERSPLLIAAVLTSIAAGCASAAAQAQPAAGEPGVRSSLTSSRASPIRRTEERYRDDKGSELVLSKDAEGNVTAKVFDSKGRPLEMRRIQLENSALVCLPASGASSASGASDPEKKNCQTLNFISDGTFIKLGKTSCTCGVCGGYGYCYGSTCR